MTIRLVGFKPDRSRRPASRRRELETNQDQVVARVQILSARQTRKPHCFRVGGAFLIRRPPAERDQNGTAGARRTCHAPTRGTAEPASRTSRARRRGSRRQRATTRSARRGGESRGASAARPEPPSAHTLIAAHRPVTSRSTAARVRIAERIRLTNPPASCTHRQAPAMSSPLRMGLPHELRSLDS